MTDRPSGGRTGGSAATDGADDEPERSGPLAAVPSGLTEPATLGIVVAVAAYVSVFASITDVVGGTTRLFGVVVVAAVCGVALARVVSPRTAVRLTGALVLVGLFAYYLAIPGSRLALGSVPAVALDVVSLLTGLSVLRLVLVEVWVLVIAPAPTFLAAYLAGRGRHVTAATVAGGTLGFFVLTGDATDPMTLAGVVGVAIAVGLSTVSVGGGLRRHTSTLAAVLAVMILASSTVTVLPAGAAQPWAVDKGVPEIESTLVADDELEIVGSTRLSPEVRFVIRSPVERKWHTGSYDRYTGDGWVRTGETRQLDGSLAGPPGDATTVETSFRAETEMETLPAPWQAVAVDGVVRGTAQVDERGTIRPGAPVLEGDRIAAASQVVDASPAELRNASTDYDPAIEERYTQLPESTPDRVGERTAEITEEAGADNPYDKAAAIEQYLIQEYDYSLSVERPEGDIADSFLFEMEAGYCTYFATTMIAMLRSQDVPARLATGYTSGQSVGDNEYVVRGQDAHAWVMVYFPEHGWIEFDPTPSADRDQARDIRLAEARSNNAEEVDTQRSAGGGISEDAEAEPTSIREAVRQSRNGTNETGGTNESALTNGSSGIDAELIGDEQRQPNEGALGTSTSTDENETPLPSRDTVGYWMFVVVVAVAGARHVGATDRAYHGIRLRLPGRSHTPRADAERAFADLERILANRYRDRRAGETPRAYLEALRSRGVDERVHAVGEAYERAAYADTVTREEADEARRTVRRIALESTPLIGGLFGE